MNATLLSKCMMYVFAISALFLNSSCSDEIVSEEVKPVEQTESGIYAETHPMELIDSRSSLVFDNVNKMMAFSWTADDKLTIFALNDDQAKQEYSLLDGAGGLKAHFTSSSFKLAKDQRYFAVSKVQNNAGGETTIPSQNNIYLDYSGQIQKGNASCDHLAKYDYMVASGLCTVEDQVYFDFQHLGFTLRVLMYTESAADKDEFDETKFTSLQIYDSGNMFRQPKRKFAFSAGYNDTYKTYVPSWPEQDIANDAKLFSIKLRSGASDTEGIKPKDTRCDGTSPTGENYRLISYIELPPVDFTNKTIGFILKGTNSSDKEVVYYATYPGFAMNMGKIYQVNLKLKKTTPYEITLKINHDWQLGNTNDSRAGTGDPGNEDKFDVPPYLYYIYCVGGYVRNVEPVEGADLTKAIPVNKIHVDGKKCDNTTDADDEWTTDKSISTYGKKLVFPMADAEKDKSKHLYVIASRTQLPETTFSGITGSTYESPTAGTPESTIRNLMYSIGGVKTPNISIDASGDAANKASQLFMRDLYSTPWDEKNFSGDLKNPVQDVFLYHVAAKVDLNWNSATPLNLTAPNNLIKVSDVNSTGLKLFTPTDNSGATGSYTVQNAITEGTMVNGRQVFYLPQFNSYNVSIGTHSYNTSGSNPVTFSPATTNGWTSWLRWLKNIKP